MDKKKKKKDVKHADAGETHARIKQQQQQQKEPQTYVLRISVAVLGDKMDEADDCIPSPPPPPVLLLGLHVGDELPTLLCHDDINIPLLSTIAP